MLVPSPDEFERFKMLVDMMSYIQWSSMTNNGNPSHRMMPFLKTWSKWWHTTLSLLRQKCRPSICSWTICALVQIPSPERLARNREHRKQYHANASRFIHQCWHHVSASSSVVADSGRCRTEFRSRRACSSCHSSRWCGSSCRRRRHVHCVKFPLLALRCRFKRW